PVCEEFYQSSGMACEKVMCSMPSNAFWIDEDVLNTGCWGIWNCNSGFYKENSICIKTLCQGIENSALINDIENFNTTTNDCFGNWECNNGYIPTLGAGSSSPTSCDLCQSGYIEFEGQCYKKVCLDIIRRIELSRSLRIEQIPLGQYKNVYVYPIEYNNNNAGNSRFVLDLDHTGGYNIMEDCFGTPLPQGTVAGYNAYTDTITILDTNNAQFDSYNNVNRVNNTRLDEIKELQLNLIQDTNTTDTIEQRPDAIRR
nr:hypothetical protein [Alphaproteobacteria bacterium]